MKNITKKQINLIIEEAKIKGRDDFDFMYVEEEKDDEGWIIDRAEIDEEEQSELYWILKDSETGITKEDIYNNNLINVVKEAYIQGWNEQSRKVRG
jgi:hypothetical protein